jgi:DNA polymerase I
MYLRLYGMLYLIGVMMRRVAMDIETENLTPNRIWVICTEDIDTGEMNTFTHVAHVQEEKERFIEYCRTVDTFVFHNGIGFDVPVINRLVAEDCISLSSVVDTLIVSRLIDYGIKDGHSLKEWGVRLNCWKGDFKDFANYSQEMVDYCIQDVKVTVKLFRKFESVINDPEWQKALRCEHDIQILCEEMTGNGFKFNLDEAIDMLAEVKLSMSDLENGFQHDFPPKLEEVNRIKYRTKADGELYSNVAAAKHKYVTSYVVDDELVCYDWKKFEPSSPQQRIDRLWEAGWTPVDKTKGHMEWERERQQANRSSWRKVS